MKKKEFFQEIVEVSINLKIIIAPISFPGETKPGSEQQIEISIQSVVLMKIQVMLEQLTPRADPHTMSTPVSYANCAYSNQ